MDVGAAFVAARLAGSATPPYSPCVREHLPRLNMVWLYSLE